MIQRRFKPIVFFMVATAACFVGTEQASLSDVGPSDHGLALKTAKVGGKWRIAWDVRLGTVQGILSLKQSATKLTGDFQQYGHTYPLSGTIQGHAITFVVPFAGPPPYTIEFKGTVDGDNDSISGTSRLADGGQAFLGHAGEVDEPQRPWMAVKGLKRQIKTPGKPPDDDDDDGRRR